MMRRGRARWEACAKRDASWLFGTHGGCAPTGPAARRQRAEVIERALQSIAPFHRGALSLWYTGKAWPAELRREFGEATSLVVRLECAAHPSVGHSTEALEAAAVERLSLLIARGATADQRALARLETRAGKHYRLAIRALAKARARSAARVDEAPVSGVLPAVETSAKECA